MDAGVQREMEVLQCLCDGLSNSLLVYGTLRNHCMELKIIDRYDFIPRKSPLGPKYTAVHQKVQVTVTKGLQDAGFLIALEVFLACRYREASTVSVLVNNCQNNNLCPAQ